MRDWPITFLQRDLIDTLRKRNNIAPETLNTLCRRLYGHELNNLSVRQASALIDALKERTGIERELQLIAGQQSLFEVNP